MFPIAARVASALASASPAIASRVLSFVQRGGQVGIKSVADLISHVRKNPVVAALTASALIDAGFAVVDLFSDEDVAKDKSGAVGRLVAQLSEQEAKQLAQVDSESDLEYGPDTASQMLLKGLIGWAATQFGSNPDVIRRHHTMLRKFVETTSADLEHGLTLYLP